MSKEIDKANLLKEIAARVRTSRADLDKSPAEEDRDFLFELAEEMPVTLDSVADVLQSVCDELRETAVKMREACK